MRGLDHGQAHETPAQRDTVERVMHEFKHGELKSAGGKVRNPKQAVAIALSEAGASNRQTPAENRKRLRKTKRNERDGRTARAESEGTTRKALYAAARRKGIRGRSRMTKAELAAAVR